MKRSSPDTPDTPDTPEPSDRRLRRLLLHAVDGCVPYLTPSVLEKHFPPSDDLWIGMAVRDICVTPTYGSNSKAKEKSEKKARGYTFTAVDPDKWLLPYTRISLPSFDLIHDNQNQKSTLASGNHHVSVWTPHGRQKLTPPLYAEASLGLQSKFTLSLFDMCGDETTEKRKEKAESRNKQWFQHLVQSRNESSSNAKNMLWSPILLPGPNEAIPETFQKAHEDDNQVSGVALVGRWREGMNKPLQNLNFRHVAMLSTHSLSEILQIACEDTINVIGTDLPTRWSKKKFALVVDVLWKDQKSKRAKNKETDKLSLNADGCIDMSDKLFARDSKPLVPGCSCLACRGDLFSRAYIHHLVCAKELLAEILLFGHNLHHLLSLLRSFNDTNDSVVLQEFIESQLGSSQTV